MFKRVRWMGMGAVAGVGASAWAQYRLRRTLQNHPSIQTGATALVGAGRAARNVGAAVADGRQAMSQLEAALRAELDRRRSGPEGASRPPFVAPEAGRAAPGRRPDLRVVNAASTPRPDRSKPTAEHPTRLAGPDGPAPTQAPRRQGR
jgi:hypothetical protein